MMLADTIQIIKENNEMFINNKDGSQPLFQILLNDS